jgi:hypothetical protein
MYTVSLSTVEKQTKGFFRDEDETIYRPLKHDYPCFSLRLYHTAAKKYAEVLRPFNAEIHRLGRRSSVVQFSLEDRRDVGEVIQAVNDVGLNPKMLIVPGSRFYNLSRILTLTSFPLMRYVEFDKEKEVLDIREDIELGDKVRIEELLNEKIVSLDIECLDDEYGIFTCSLIEGRRKSIDRCLVYTIFDPGVDVFYEDKHRVEVVVCEDERDLVKRVSDEIRIYSPLYLTGYNIMSYDLDKLKRVRTKTKDPKTALFRPAPDGSQPRERARITQNFGKRNEVAGMWIIDPDPFTRKFALGLPRYGLVNVSHAFEIPFEKEMDFEGIKDRQRKAVSGSIKSSAEIAKYCYKDALTAFLLAGDMLENVLATSLDFETEPTKTCHSDFSSNHWETIRFDALKEVRKKRSKNLEQFDERVFKDLMLLGRLGFERGIYPVDVYFVPLIARGLEEISCYEQPLYFLRKHYPRLYACLDERSEDGSVQKIITYQSIEAGAKELLLDLFDDDVPSWLFSKRYLNTYSIDDAKKATREALKKRLDEYSLSLAERKVVNVSKGYVFVKTEDGENISNLTPHSDFVYFGTAVFVSFYPRVIAGNIDGEPRSFGIDIVLKNKYKTKFEKNLLWSIFTSPFLGKKEIMKQLEEARERLLNGKVEPEELIRIVNPGLNPEEYSRPSLGRKPVKIARQRGVKKGERFAFGYLEGESDVDAEHFFRMVSEGMPIDAERYLNEMFGNRPFKDLEKIAQSAQKRHEQLPLNL